MDAALIAEYLYSLGLVLAGVLLGIVLAYFVHLRETERLQEEVGELRTLTEEYHGFAAGLLASPYWDVFGFHNWGCYPTVAASLSHRNEE